MERLTKHNGNYCDDCGCMEKPDEFCACDEEIAMYEKLMRYEDAKEQGRLFVLPCKIGDKVRDKVADYVFTVEQIELGHKAGTLFRCGNPGTGDYMAFYDFEIGEKIELLTH